jgi:hypothetical protein
VDRRLPRAHAGPPGCSGWLWPLSWGWRAGAWGHGRASQAPAWSPTTHGSPEGRGGPWWLLSARTRAPATTSSSGRLMTVEELAPLLGHPLAQTQVWTHDRGRGGPAGRSPRTRTRPQTAHHPRNGLRTGRPLQWWATYVSGQVSASCRPAPEPTRRPAPRRVTQASTAPPDGSRCPRNGPTSPDSGASRLRSSPRRSRCTAHSPTGRTGNEQRTGQGQEGSGQVLSDAQHRGDRAVLLPVATPAVRSLPGQGSLCALHTGPVWPARIHPSSPPTARSSCGFVGFHCSRRAVCSALPMRRLK